MFSQHSRRHSNDTNSDLSDDEIFLPDEAKLSMGSGGIRRTSKTGEILASPTHRKLTPTHIKSTGSSPIKRAIQKHSRNQFRSFDDGDKIEPANADEIHEHYRKVIAELKQMHEDNVKHMQYKLQSLEGPPPDDEYLVSTSVFCTLEWLWQKVQFYNHHIDSHTNTIGLRNNSIFTSKKL